MKNAREAALQILIAVDFKGAYSNLALKDGLSGLSSVDKGFATRLVYGCISMRLTIDYIISRYSKTKIKKLSACVLEILRMGIYQIYFMDRIPDSAAVNESVKLAARHAAVSRGFVNGVLRSAARGKENLTYPEDKTEYLSVKYSFPIELCVKFEDMFGFERAESLLCAFSKEPETIIRANTLKTTREELKALIETGGAEVRIIEELPDALAVSGLDVGSSIEYKSGLFTVQDTAAQLACLVLAPKSGDTVFDMCAAPGGKTTYLAELMKDKGFITAFDIYPHKTELIDENASRLGISIIESCTFNSAAYQKELAGRADKVLADVPCSGSGILRRKPEIKWNMTDVNELCKIQRKILENAVSYAAPGGEIVYSTCSVMPEENEKAVEAFLSEHPEAEAVDISPLLPEKFRKPTASEGYITLYPDTDGTDGFFICKLRKKQIPDN